MTASTRSAGNRSAPAPPPSHVELPPGILIGRYRVGEEIGRGSYAVVYQAFDTWLNRDVALKTLPLQCEAMARHEAQLLCRVQHRNVVTLHDLIRHGPVHALVLELVRGPSLRVVVREGPLGVDEVLEIGAQLASGLEGLHGAGILHRDIKPANLRLTADGVLKLLDLGVGCRLTPADGRESCAAAPVAGTVPYMSPERLQGACGDPRSDVWSAGAVLFELATGQRMVDGLDGTAQDRFVRDGCFPDPWVVASRLPRPLAAVVARALAPAPADRYQSARDFLEDLSRLAPRTLARELSMVAVA